MIPRSSMYIVILCAMAIFLLCAAHYSVLSSTKQSTDLTFVLEQNVENASIALNSKNKVDDIHSWAIRHFNEAGIPLRNHTLALLPTTDELLKFVGKSPVFVHGDGRGTHRGAINQCEKFRQGVPNENDRWIGVAGIFNTGTNLLHKLLVKNCIMPGGQKNVYWQVPWGKHGYATSRNRTAFQFIDDEIEFNRDHGLVVVTTRDPYEWSKSMCRNPYVVTWDDDTSCPNLASKVNLWGKHENILHLWNLWHRKYVYEFPYPRVIVRNEDLTLRPRETVEKICACAGGQLTKEFKHVTKSLKNGEGHSNEQTSLVDAWSKFHWPRDPRGGLSIEDYSIAKQSLGEKLMSTFGYSHPE